MAATPRSGGPGQPWSDIETSHLISAYAEKWYSLKRGPLKAHQWEEVASALSARCGLRFPSKNGTQCRHKMEKLRKRYRAEQKLPPPSRWPHFQLMDRMESGAPIPSPPDADAEDEEEPEQDGENHQLVGRRSGDCGLEARRASVEEDEEEAPVGRRLASHLASSVTRFAEQFQRIEKRRMEAMEEMERAWMDMESSRTRMVVEWHRHLVDAVALAYSNPAKKARR